MGFLNVLIVVEDIEKSKKFYYDVLGLKVICDFGENVVLEGNISLQEKKLWLEFINKSDSEVKFNGNDAELYFEEDYFDTFVERLSTMRDIDYVHLAIEHRWGQRAIRFYDLDGHIIEVGETMSSVCRRFLDSGLSIDEVAKRMDVTVEYIESVLE